MDYQLTIWRGKPLPLIDDPSPEAIEEAINELLPMEDHFVILESGKKVANCSFIQTQIHDEKKDDNDTPIILFHVEVRFDYDKSLFKQYQTHISDIELVKKLFRMFALEVIPDVTGWIDITNDLIRKREEKASEQPS